MRHDFLDELREDHRFGAQGYGGCLEFRGLEEAGAELIEIDCLLIDQLCQLDFGLIEGAQLLQTGTGGADDGEWGFEGVSERIQDRNAQLFCLFCALGPSFLLGGAGAFQGNGRERRNGVGDQGVDLSANGDGADGGVADANDALAGADVGVVFVSIEEERLPGNLLLVRKPGPLVVEAGRRRR